MDLASSGRSRSAFSFAEWTTPCTRNLGSSSSPPASSRASSTSFPVSPSPSFAFLHQSFLSWKYQNSYLPPHFHHLPPALESVPPAPGATGPPLRHLPRDRRRSHPHYHDRLVPQGHAAGPRAGRPLGLERRHDGLGVGRRGLARRRCGDQACWEQDRLALGLMSLSPWRDIGNGKQRCRDAVTMDVIAQFRLDPQRRAF